MYLHNNITTVISSCAPLQATWVHCLAKRLSGRPEDKEPIVGCCSLTASSVLPPVFDIHGFLWTLWWTSVRIGSWWTRCSFWFNPAELMLFIYFHDKNILRDSEISTNTISWIAVCCKVIRIQLLFISLLVWLVGKICSIEAQPFLCF